jgi:WD40 repeat protein
VLAAVDEWRMAPSVIKEPKVNLRGHTYWCRAVQWSPDGDLLATASADNNVRVFQQCGTEAFKVKHPDWVWAVDFSFTSKRKRLATACLDGKVRVFDAIDGREILTIQVRRRLSR